MLVAAVVLVAGVGGAQAATLSAGPLLIGENNTYSCAAVNIGTKDIAVEVSVTIDGSSAGSGTVEACPALAPRTVCAGTNSGATNFRYCTVKTSSKTSTRATFCNRTTGICIPLQ
jgi:hypothetical protein